MFICKDLEVDGRIAGSKWLDGLDDLPHVEQQDECHLTTAGFSQYEARDSRTSKMNTYCEL